MSTPHEDAAPSVAERIDADLAAVRDGDGYYAGNPDCQCDGCRAWAKTRDELAAMLRRRDDDETKGDTDR